MILWASVRFSAYIMIFKLFEKKFKKSGQGLANMREQYVVSDMPKLIKTLR